MGPTHVRTSNITLTDPIEAGAPPALIPTFWVLLLATPGAAIVAAAIATQTYLSMLGHGHSFTGILAWQLSCWLPWALAAPVVLRIGGGLTGPQYRSWAAWRRVLWVGFVFVAAHILLVSQFNLWFQPYVPITTLGYRQAFVIQLGSLFPIDWLAYATLVLGGVALSIYYRARQLEVLESQLHADLARAQLEALRLEIQPHFLFNTLNAISALIRSKSNDRALDMLVGLSDLMRQTLGRTGEQVVTLERELELTTRYVDLQQARFRDRLTVRYEIADPCRARSVPTFVLQPLVENALRHGMGRQARHLQLEVGARLEDDERLHLWISDDGVGLAPGFTLERDARTGLGNTSSRLRRLYGRAARLDVRSGREGGVVADVFIPSSQVGGVEATA